MILVPIMTQQQSETQDVFSSDCRRMLATDRKALGEGKDEIDEYWLRLEPDSIEEPTARKSLQLE
jgi:hypothetical protein